MIGSTKLFYYFNQEFVCEFALPNKKLIDSTKWVSQQPRINMIK